MDSREEGIVVAETLSGTFEDLDRVVDAFEQAGAEGPMAVGKLPARVLQTIGLIHAQAIHRSPPVSYPDVEEIVTDLGLKPLEEHLLDADFTQAHAHRPQVGPVVWTQGVEDGRISSHPRPRETRSACLRRRSTKLVVWRCPCWMANLSKDRISTTGK